MDGKFSLTLLHGQDWIQTKILGKLEETCVISSKRFWVT